MKAYEPMRKEETSDAWKWFSIVGVGVAIIIALALLAMESPAAANHRRKGGKVIGGKIK